MDIQEMHNSVIQGVDKINAQIADTLLAGEIDRELNKAIQQFVSIRFQKNNKHMQGFEESQKRRDDLRTLIREVESNVSFKETIRESTHASGALFVDTWTLPENYMHLINVSATIERLHDCSKISYQLMDQDPVPYWVLNLKDFFANGGTTYIDEFWIVTDIEQDWGSDEWAGTLVWQNPEQWQNVDYTTDNAQQFWQDWAAGMQFMLPIYWEQWDPNIQTEGDTGGFNIDLVNNWFGNPESINYPGSFIVTFNLSALEDLLETMNADASLGPITYAVARFNNGSVKYVPMTFEEDLEHRRVPTTTHFLREVYPCRLVQHDDIFKLVDDPFNKMTYSSPLTVMRGHHLDIYSDDLYITDRIRLTYLIRPQIVSLADDITCDLPVATHEEICKLAVLTILEEISDPRFNTHLMQVDKME